MTKASVTYRAPVLVEVDTATGTVTAVRVIDEKVTPDSGRPVWFPDADGSDEAAELAIAIAESADWPAWEIG